MERKSPRANFLDYSGGDFFITICTKEKRHYFGTIKDCVWIPSRIGKFCDQQFKEIEKHYPYAKTLIHQVMPNHVHAIIRIYHNDWDKEVSDMHYTVPETRTLLGIIIGGIKRAVTCHARRNKINFDWQPRYHDHFIRGTHDGDRIWEYILFNVENWNSDCFYD